MNGTPIDSLKFMQPNQPHQYTNMQTSDLIEDAERQQMTRDDRNIGDIAQEVSDSLDNLPEKPPQRQHIKPKQIINDNVNKDKFMYKLPQIVREPLIIAVIYIILSLDVVKKTLSTYIPQVKQTTDGNVLFTGVVVYALIFAIMYVVAKKLLL